MTDKINLRDMEKKAQKLLNEDGVMELLMGAILFITSSSFSGTPIFTPFLGLYVIFMKNIVEKYRKRFTYPRIGYLKLPDDDSKEIGVGILTFLGAIMLGLLVFIYIATGGVTGTLVYKWMPTIMGLILFGGLYYSYQKSGDKTHLVYILIAISTGVFFSLQNFPDAKDGVQLYLLWMSGVFITAGLIRLYKFTRRYAVVSVDVRGSDNE